MLYSDKPHLDPVLKLTRRAFSLGLVAVVAVLGSRTNTNLAAMKTTTALTADSTNRISLLG